MGYQPSPFSLLQIYTSSPETAVMLSWGSGEKAAQDPLVLGFQKMPPVTLPVPLEKKKAQERAGPLPLWARVSRGQHILSDGKERWSGVAGKQK